MTPESLACGGCKWWERLSENTKGENKAGELGSSFHPTVLPAYKSAFINCVL